MSSTLHEQDFYTWTFEQSQLLREGRFAELDVEYLIDELEDMGGSKQRELEGRLGVLLAHLLKWRYQPERRGNSWEATIEEQRRRIARLLRKNPGLKSCLTEAWQDGYGDARLIAMRETGLHKSVFPEMPLFTLEQTLDPGFWPDG